MIDRDESGTFFFVTARLFRCLQKLSPAIEPKPGPPLTADAQKRKLKHNDRFVANVLLGELIAVALTGFSWSSTATTWAAWRAFVLALFAGWRVIDILQASVNTLLFDPFWEGAERQRFLSVRRKILLTSVNYVELLVLFGLIYSAGRSSFAEPLKEWYDAFYFSGVTQLTIGYGEIQPVGWNKLVAVMQGLLSFFFAVLLLARIVSVLPEVQELRRASRPETAPESGGGNAGRSGRPTSGAP
jgi:hypothetical protein